MMDQAMAAVIGALIGALGGNIVTGIISYFLKKSDEKLKRQKEMLVIRRNLYVELIDCLMQIMYGEQDGVAKEALFQKLSGLRYQLLLYGATKTNNILAEIVQCGFDISQQEMVATLINEMRRELKVEE